MGQTTMEFNNMDSIAQKTNKMNKLTFGQRLTQIRKAMGLTQVELGKRRAGVTSCLVISRYKCPIVKDLLRYYVLDRSLLLKLTEYLRVPCAEPRCVAALR